MSDLLIHPIHYVTDPEADASWAEATLQAADKVVIEDAMIVAIQYERWYEASTKAKTGPIKVEYRWVLGTYDRYANVAGETVTDGQGIRHVVRTIQSVLEDDDA